MGEAKRRKQADSGTEARILQAAEAVSRYMQACGVNQRGRDCEAHAKLLQTLLEGEGIPSRVVAGVAAWRVGLEDGAVPAHGFGGFGPGSFAGHFWVEAGLFIADATSWQWPLKLRAAEDHDGIPARVEWPREALVLLRSRVRTFEEVRDGYTFACHYQERPEFAPYLERVLAEPLDPEDVRQAQAVYRHPRALILGPANLQTEADQ